MDTASISQTIDQVFQVIMLLLPIVAAIATWFLRTYVKSAKAEKSVAAIVRLSNAAIDFAEDLDKRGDLGKYLEMWNMPPDVVNLTSNGLKKLNLAGKWLETELARQGIQMTNEEAKTWVAAQFQNRVGDLGQDRGVSERTQEAVSLLRTLQQNGLITLPDDRTQVTMLSDAVASWVLGQLEKEGASDLREKALSRVESELASGSGAPGAPVAPTVDSQLADLARQSVEYVQQLKASHHLTLPETDVAVAWVLTEVTKQSLNVTTEQIAAAVRTAFQQQETG